MSRVEILGLIHESGPSGGVPAEAAAERGDTLEEWSLAWNTPPPRPLDEYDAVVVYGGVMHAHEEHYHPWLREETMLMQRFLDQGVPLLGICLGGQLIAKAAHAPVSKAREPEIGWNEVELLPQAAGDPVLGRLPRRFASYQWHYYGFDLPGAGVPLARSSVCLQAFRLGERAWALQFHCEVTREIIERWMVEAQQAPGDLASDFDPARMREETELYIERWNEIGFEISNRFFAVAARSPRPSRVLTFDSKHS